MTDINKVPDADVIAQRIFSVMDVHKIQQDMVSNILSDWSEEWIDYIAENQTGMSDGTKRSNDDRLKRRMNRLAPVSPIKQISSIDSPGF